MFFMGFNAFGDKSSHFATTNIVNDLRRIELRDIIIDELNIDDNINVIYKTDKTTWTFSTRLLARFKDNLEAGNIDVSGLEIEHIKLRRRIKGETQWQDYITWNFDIEKRSYMFYDKYVINAETYEYAIVPIAVGGVVGVSNYGEIAVKYQHYYLMDKNHTYRLLYNAAYSGVKEKILSSSIMPMGSKYPIVSFNSDLDFAEGSFSGLFYLDDLCGRDNINPLDNIKESREYKDGFMKFLKNKQAKVLKDEAGNMRLCTINGDIDINFKAEFSNVVADMSFPWIEIGDVTNSDDLKKRGLLEMFY